jgi:hypothetical protein
MPPVQRCIMHTMGFSDMVEPLVRFLLEALEELPAVL